jgi:crotonobetainyl-CoA:carnitine CoA-transferase CaiB-like acyl-CoA transferase
VVKVEPPGGAEERHTAPHIHHMLNRGKRSVCVDLKTEKGLELVHELVDDHVDVLLVNYRPGVLSRFDLDYDTLTERNDDLIYCSLTGFGDDGPYSDRPALDPIAQAMSGIMVMTGDPDRKPSRIGGSLIDIGAATNAVLAVSMALRQRDHDGGGQKVEASLFETAFGWGGEWGTYYTLYDEVPQRMGDSKASYAPVGAYETEDGLVYLAAFGNQAWERLCKALNIEGKTEDERFAEPENRQTNREELDEIIETETRKYSRESLVNRLLEFSIPAARIGEIPEVIEDPHLWARDMILEMESENDTDIVVPTTPVKMGAAEPEDSTKLPDLGEDTEEIANSIGYSQSEIESVLDQSEPQ